MEPDEITPYLNGTCTLVALKDRYVIVKLPEHLPTAERGRRLLSLEKQLRGQVNPVLEVLLEPKLDQNKLRQKLRGVSFSETRPT
jgi:hypothetical protein